MTRAAAGGPSAHMGCMEKQQLTLGGLLEALDAVPRDAELCIAGFGIARYPGDLFRHRPFVDGVSIAPVMVGKKTTGRAGAFADHLRRTAFGLAWSFPDGRDDPFLTGWDTPVWAGTRHKLSFNAVTHIDLIDGYAVIRSMDMAPMQGPRLQRIPDEEAAMRMRIVDVALRGEAKVLAPKAERYLVNYIPRDRSTVLERLAEAREDLDDFEASLQAKRDLVAKLEADAARHDYLLGIRDDLPGTEPGCNGLCHRASDVGVSVPGDPVAYAHESCPEHGSKAK